MANIKTIKFLLAGFLITQANLSCANQNPTTVDSKIQEIKTMSNEDTSCKTNKIIRSQKLINFIFADINTTYSQTGGGGITAIKETATNVFNVSISQEERIDVLTYHLDVDEECNIKLIKTEESTITFGH